MGKLVCLGAQLVTSTVRVDVPSECCTVTVFVPASLSVAGATTFNLNSAVSNVIQGAAGDTLTSVKNWPAHCVLYAFRSACLKIFMLVCVSVRLTFMLKLSESAKHESNRKAQPKSEFIVG